MYRMKKAISRLFQCKIVSKIPPPHKRIYLSSIGNSAFCQVRTVTPHTLESSEMELVVAVPEVPSGAVAERMSTCMSGAEDKDLTG